MRNSELKERKTVTLELKDLDTTKRTAVIAHAVYNNIDRTNDISCKGMFDKTWRENKEIDFLFNHVKGQSAGYVLRTFDDEEKAYTEVKFGDWTLGEDVFKMAQAPGVIKGASFGYVAEKKEFVEVKGRRVRRLKEVYHAETSLLTVDPANPLAGIVSLQKSLEQEDFNEALTEISTRINNLDRFCRNTKASDQCIINALEEIKSLQQYLSEYNTAATHLANEPEASIDGKELAKVIRSIYSTLNS